MNTDLSWSQAADDCRLIFESLQARNPATCHLLDPLLWKALDTTREPIEIAVDMRSIIFPHLFGQTIDLLVASWTVPERGQIFVPERGPVAQVYGGPSTGGTFDGVPSEPPSNYRLPPFGPPATDTSFYRGGGSIPNLSRRAPAYPVYDPTNNELQRIFSKCLERDILSQPSAVAAQRFVRALMGGNDNGFLENANFVNAVSPQEVLGALLCEVEGVDTPVELIAAIQNLERPSSMTYLDFVGKLNQRHQSYIAAYGNAPHIEQLLLTRAANALKVSEWCVRVATGNCKSVVELNMVVRRLKMGLAGTSTASQRTLSVDVMEPDVEVVPEALGVNNVQSSPAPVSTADQGWQQGLQALTHQVQCLMASQSQASRRGGPAARANQPPREVRCWNCDSLEHKLNDCPTAVHQPGQQPQRPGRRNANARQHGGMYQPPQGGQNNYSQAAWHHYNGPSQRQQVYGYGPPPPVQAPPQAQWQMRPRHGPMQLQQPLPPYVPPQQHPPLQSQPLWELPRNPAAPATSPAAGPAAASRGVPQILAATQEPPADPNAQYFLGGPLQA